MSRKFSLIKDPHVEGENVFKKDCITIKDGVTVLVGCNGIGKTSLIKEIKRELKKEEIPFVLFDNLNDGGSNARSASCFRGDFSFLAESMCSSEGENIVLNIMHIAKNLKRFIETGISKDFLPENEKVVNNERWILFDAVDSGLSIDNIIDLKEGLFKTILENSYRKDIYIIVSANEYEMANGEKCFDVYNGEYINFDNYEEYRKMIIESRDIKDKRNNKE